MAQDSKQVRQDAVQDFKKSLDQLQERLQGVESSKPLSETIEANALGRPNDEQGSSSHNVAPTQKEPDVMEVPPLDPQVLEEAAQDIDRYMRSRQDSSPS